MWCQLLLEHKLKIEIPMNRFVIVLTEDYDQFSVGIPNAIITRLSLDDLISEMKKFYLSLPVCKREGFVDHRADYNNRHKVFNIPDTEINLSPSDLEILCTNQTKAPYHYEFHHPPIYTIDEWFDKMANLRIK